MWEAARSTATGGADHGVVADEQLTERARNAGIATEYHDWQGHRVVVPAETLAEILAVLERQPHAPAPTESLGSHGAHGSHRALVQAPSAATLALPATRQWGFTVQLYSLRSASSWGHGDLHDLGELARWSGTELGAGFVLVNPLHAAEPRPPVSPSPYLPMTRLFTSPLYLRVEDILEYGQLPQHARHQIAELAA
ncbi:MAG: 4-alpha-glucanotransferase, partial [Actinobacteria bacterium]|nr:4-alpha-glucanotransferase [Actinomycetota bacterium]